MRKSISILCTGAALLSLAACGTDPADRALSGGGIGAGTGAVGAAILGANPLVGALVGGGVGAAAGGLTSPNTVDLDRR